MADDSKESIARALADKLGPQGLIVAGAIGGGIWLESQQPGTIGAWLSAIVALTREAGPVLAVLLLVQWIGRAQDRRIARAERLETAAVLSELSQATLDSSGALTERIGKMEAMIDRALSRASWPTS